MPFALVRLIAEPALGILVSNLWPVQSNSRRLAMQGFETEKAAKILGI
jgi:hypothetical protein